MRPHRREAIAFTNICALMGEDYQNMQLYAFSWVWKESRAKRGPKNLVYIYIYIYCIYLFPDSLPGAKHICYIPWNPCLDSSVWRAGRVGPPIGADYPSNQNSIVQFRAAIVHLVPALWCKTKVWLL